MTTDFLATAADAAVLQLTEESSIAHHPAKALFDRAVKAILPAVRSFAQAKNVPIDDHEQLGMARYSAHTVGHSTLQGIMTLEPDAIEYTLRTLHSEGRTATALWGGERRQEEEPPPGPEELEQRFSAWVAK